MDSKISKSDPEAQQFQTLHHDNQHNDSKTFTSGLTKLRDRPRAQTKFEKFIITISKVLSIACWVIMIPEIWELFQSDIYSLSQLSNTQHFIISFLLLIACLLTNMAAYLYGSRKVVELPLSYNPSQWLHCIQETFRATYGNSRLDEPGEWIPTPYTRGRIKIFTNFLLSPEIPHIQCLSRTIPILHIMNNATLMIYTSLESYRLGCVQSAQPSKVIVIPAMKSLMIFQVVMVAISISAAYELGWDIKMIANAEKIQEKIDEYMDISPRSFESCLMWWQESLAKLASGEEIIKTIDYLSIEEV